MGRRQLYTDEQLKRYVVEYVTSLTAPSLITATDIVKYINDTYNFSNPLGYWHLTRRKEVMKYIASFNERLEEYTDTKDEKASVLPDYGIDIDRILQIKDDEAALRVALASANRQIIELTELVHAYQKKSTELERKLSIVEDRAQNAERKHPDNKGLKADLLKYRKKAVDMKRYMDGYVAAGIKKVLIAEGHLDDEGEELAGLPDVMADRGNDDLMDSVTRYADVMAFEEEEDPFVIEDDAENEPAQAVYSEHIGRALNELDDL